MKTIKVRNRKAGFEICKNFLYETLSKNSVLFLSGGKTPKTLYEILAKEQRLKTGAAALVDERYGQKLHENSNEKMIQDTGLIEYLGKINVPLYPVLEDKEIEETTKDYDETVRYLFNYFQKCVGILGIGTDGHTAGIPARTQNSSIRNIRSSSFQAQARYKSQTETDLVTSFDSFPGEFKERITLTFLGISKLDEIIVLVFGKDKQKAMEALFKGEDVYEIPASFLKTSEISKKTTIITDLSLI